MHRFYIPEMLDIDHTLKDVSIIYQLTKVLRAQVGMEISLFNGDGSEMIYTIEAISKHTLQLRGKDRIFPLTEPKKSIILYQALPNKIEKIEYILQK
jgi:16S rRNA (uracil1498-N3)-methyltransferase